MRYWAGLKLVYFFEDLRKVLEVAVAHPRAYFRHGQAAFLQKLLGMLHANAHEILGKPFAAFLFEQRAEITDAEPCGGANVLQGDGLAVMLLHILLGDADRTERLAAAADILGFHVLFFKADQAVEQLVRPAGKARFMRKGRLLSAIKPKEQGKEAACRTHQLRQLIPAHAGKLHRLACQGVGTVHRKARIQRGEGLFDFMAVALQKAGIPQPGGSGHALQQASGALQQPLIDQLAGLTHQRGKPGGEEAASLSDSETTRDPAVLSGLPAG